MFRTGKIGRIVLSSLAVSCVLWLMLSARSTGTGFATYKQPTYYTYLIIAFVLNCVAGWGFSNIKVSYMIIAFSLLISHIACSVEEAIFIRKYEALGSPPVPRLFDSNCWMAYDIDLQSLSAGD